MFMICCTILLFVKRNPALFKRGGFIIQVLCHIERSVHSFPASCIALSTNRLARRYCSYLPSQSAAFSFSTALR